MKLSAFLFILVCQNFSSIVQGAKKASKALLEDISDHKELKKLLKTKNNVLINFIEKSGKSDILSVLKDVAEKVKGSGTIATVNCGSGDGKKLCKKYKITFPPTANYVLKHYKDGEFHKNYDRLETVASMTTFLKDPTGDAPWQEDPASSDVVHILDAKQFAKLLKNERGRLLIEFYAPWCGFCKKLKPDYQAAATEIKGTAVMAAIDVTRSENGMIGKKYNITGFPTILYFENGVQQYPYPGDNNKAAIISFLKDPKPEVAKKAPEKEWKDEPSEVVHLTDDAFEPFVQENPSVFVMFYAPWCGHCKNLKPKFVSAAAKLKEENIEGKLAAIDCTKETNICKKFSVNGYPTLKYFKDGEQSYEAGHAREEKQIIDFMKDPKEAPPPPPPEKPWSEEASDVQHLNEENFKPFLKKKKHVLVMFYAPWCGHCKRAKPEFTETAAHFKDNSKVEVAAVDCTIERSVCSAYEVSGFPTFKYFKYFNKEQKDYNGGRTKNDFIQFLEDPENPLSGRELPKPNPETEWRGFEGAENVKHLTTEDFHSEIKTNEHVLVMFYAPWCGHCKSMKGDYSGAAKRLAQDNSKAVLAAVDATVEQSLGNVYNIKGYPTLKYFYKGTFYEEYNGGRRKMDFVEYLKKKIVSGQKDEL